MQYSVLHFSKLKASGGGIGAHIDRRHTPHNADPSRTKDNWELVIPHHGLHYDINQRIKKGYDHRRKDGSLKKIRHDAVKAIGTIISGSHEQMKEIEKRGELKKWAYENLEWMENKFGSENILRFTLHMDEKTPHIHCVFTPIVDGRLCAKDVLGDKEQLSKLQDEHAALNSKFGLKRGLKHTRLKHTTTREYYATMGSLEEEAEIKTTSLGLPKPGEKERLKHMAVHQKTLLYNAKADSLRKIAEAKKHINEGKQKNAKISDLSDEIIRVRGEYQKLDEIKTYVVSVVKNAMYGNREEKEKANEALRRMYKPPHTRTRARERDGDEL